MTTKVSLIVAHSKNFVIGKDNKLLWHLSDDLKNFKRLSLNKVVLMGRKTFESIGRPLPKRVNLVFSRDKNLKIEGATVVNSLEEVFSIVEGELVVIGGGEIYQLFLPFATDLHVTEVDCELEGDTHFPQIDLEKYKKIEEISHEKDAKNEYAWVYRHYTIL